MFKNGLMLVKLYVRPSLKKKNNNDNHTACTILYFSKKFWCSNKPTT